MSQSISVVGLDVHATQTAVAVIEPLTGELRRTRIRGGTSELVAFLETLGPHRAVHEAGPTGLGLARKARARARGVPLGGGAARLSERHKAATLPGRAR